MLEGTEGTGGRGGVVTEVLHSYSNWAPNFSSPFKTENFSNFSGQFIFKIRQQYVGFAEIQLHKSVQGYEPCQIHDIISRHVWIRMLGTCNLLGPSLCFMQSAYWQEILAYRRTCLNFYISQVAHPKVEGLSGCSSHPKSNLKHTHFCRHDYIKLFTSLYFSAEIINWNRLMTSTLEFWKIRLKILVPSIEEV
jgi:hypothetical protein